MSTGAEGIRQRAARVAAVVLVVVVLLAGWAATATAAPFSRTTQNGVNNLRADTLTSPGAPVPLRVTAASGMTSLTWTASRAYASYRLERATSPTGPFSQLALLAPETSGFREFSLPPGTAPYGITVGSDGALWFTARDSNQIGRITTSGTTTWFTIPTTDSRPETIVAGPDGALWFTETAGNKIGRITVGGTISEYDVPTAASVPKSITSGADGNLYFTEQATDKVARITTAGDITELVTLPAASAGPHGIAWGPDQNLWVTTAGADGLTRVTPAGTATRFATPTASSGPTGIAVGPSGDLGFTESTGHRIGRFAPYYDTFSVTEYSPPTASSGPFGIAAGGDGNMWVTQRDRNRIARVNSTGVVTEFAVPTAGSAPTSIAAGPDGAMWFTERGANKIGRYALGLTTGFTDTTAIAGQHYYYRAYAVYNSWTSATAGTAMSLSMAPTSGGDATGGTGTATPLSAGEVSALGRADNATHTTAGDWRTNWTLRGVDTRDGVRVWGVGDGGLMALSTDGGATWTQQPSVTAVNLRRVRFVDTNTGWAVGDGGTIIVTTDGGTSWNTQLSGTTANLRGVSFLGATLGWAVGDGGTILFWNGTSWSPYASGTTNDLRGVAAGSATRAWAVGSGGTVQTYDGSGWSNFEINGRPPLHDVAAVDGTRAWIVGDSGRLFNVDGATESLKNQNVSTMQHLYSVVTFGTSVWVAGANGTMRHYNGSSWSSQTSNTTADITGLAFSSASTGYYVTAGGRPGRTTDAGQTWAGPLPKSVEIAFPTATVQPGAQVHTLRATLVYRTSAVPATDAIFSVRASFDGGATWTSRTLTRPTSTATVTQTVDFAPAVTNPAALQANGIRLSFQVTSSNAFTTAHDMVRVDVN